MPVLVSKQSALAKLRREVKLDSRAAPIEKGSRNPAGNREHRSATKPWINEEILKGRFDPDEIEHEHELEQHCRPRSSRSSNVLMVDPLAGIDQDLCRCSDGKSCQICVTDQDLMAFPKNPLIDREQLPAAAVVGINRFRLTMPIWFARAIGLMRSDYNIVAE